MRKRLAISLLVVVSVLAVFATASWVRLRRRAWASSPEAAVALNEAVHRGDATRVSALLGRGVAPDARDPEGFRGIPSFGVGYHPLHWAAMQGDVQMVDLLVAAGADVNGRNDRGETPLQVGAQYSKADVVAALAGRGGDVDARDQDGCTPLHVAAREGCRPIAELLRKHGGAADGSGGDDLGEGGEPHLAPHGVQWQRDTVEALIDAGADVNAQDNRGWTPLREAVEGNVIWIE